MRPIVLHLVFITLTCGGEDEGGKEERLQSYQSNFARRKREIADAIIALVEDVIQAEGEHFGELPGSVATQNISSSKFRDISRRIKEEVSIEVLLEKDLSKPKIMFSPGMRSTFGRKNQNLVKTKQVEVFEQGKIKEGGINEDTLKDEDKIVEHEQPIFIPMKAEEDTKYVVIETLADKDLSRKKGMFSSPGSRTNFKWKRRDIITTVKDQTLGQKHVEAESSGQIRETTDKKSEVKLEMHDQSRTEVIKVPAEKDLSRNKRMFSPGRRTYFRRNRRDVFNESKENVLESNVQIEEISRQESRHIPQTGKRLEIMSLKTDSVQHRTDNLYPYTFSPFRGIFLFPFNTGFADFGNHLMVSPTTPRPSSITTLAPQKARPVHILECSGTSSSSCNNGFCTVECSEGNKVEVDCDKSSMVVKTKVVEGRISVSVYCGET